MQRMMMAQAARNQKAKVPQEVVAVIQDQARESNGQTTKLPFISHVILRFLLVITFFFLQWSKIKLRSVNPMIQQYCK